MSLEKIHREIRACKACPRMIGPPVHGPAVDSGVFLLGQAPGPREGARGRPFAHTAGKTLFRWFEEAGGVSEERFRAGVYMAAVARCFPGKAPGGGDRVPDAEEIERCSRHLKRELEALEPQLLIAVGTLAISQVLGAERYGPKSRLTDVIGRSFDSVYHGQRVEVICLPHPSGVSAWPKKEPGKTLLAKALRLIVTHPRWRDTFRK